MKQILNIKDLIGEATEYDKKAFKMGQGESYEEYCEWLGVDNVDLATFDIEDMNFRLKKVPRIFCDLYEKGLVPTQQSIDILERNYK